MPLFASRDLRKQCYSNLANVFYLLIREKNEIIASTPVCLKRKTKLMSYCVDREKL